MAEEDVKINHIVGDLAVLPNKQYGIDNSADVDTGEKHTHYRDNDGNPHKNANLREPATFTDLVATVSFTFPGGEDIDDYQLLSEKNTASGYAGLDSSTKLALAIMSRGMAIGESFEFTNSAKSGTPDKYEVKNSDMTLLRSQAAFSQNVFGGSVAIDDDCVYVCYSSPDTVIRYNRRTGQEIESVAAPANRALVVRGDSLLLITSTSSIRKYNKNDLTDYVDLTGSGDSFSSAVFNAFYNDDDDLIYVVSGVNEYGTIEVTSETTATVTLIADISSSLANDSVGICLSYARDSVYIIDSGASTSAYVREFNLLTGALVTSSSAVTTTTSDHDGDNVFIASPAVVGVSLRGKVVYLDDTLSTLFTGSSELGSVLLGYYGGILYGGLQVSATVVYSEYKPPHLTVTEPEYINSRGGDGIYSAEGVFGPDGALFEWLKSETATLMQSWATRFAKKSRVWLTEYRHKSVLQSDRNNIIYVDGTCTAASTLDILVPDGILSQEGFVFWVAMSPDGLLRVYGINVVHASDTGYGFLIKSETNDTYITMFRFEVLDGLLTADANATPIAP